MNLPLHVAQAEDADNQGAAFWHAGCPANDYRADVWERRRRCYDLILDSLAVFETRQGDHSQMEQMRDEFKLALNAPDQMFHSVLYDWMLERGAADALVKVGALNVINVSDHCLSFLRLILLTLCHISGESQSPPASTDSSRNTSRFVGSIFLPLRFWEQWQTHQGA